MTGAVAGASAGGSSTPAAACEAPKAPESPKTSPAQDAASGGVGGAAGGSAADAAQAVGQLGGPSSEGLVKQLEELLAKIKDVLANKPAQSGAIAGAAGGDTPPVGQHGCDHKHEHPKGEAPKQSTTAGANGGPDQSPVQQTPPKAEPPKTDPPRTALAGATGGGDGKVVQDATKLGGPTGNAVAGVAQLDPQLVGILSGLVDVLGQLAAYLGKTGSSPAPGTNPPAPPTGGTPPSTGTTPPAPPAGTTPPAHGHHDPGHTQPVAA